MDSGKGVVAQLEAARLRHRQAQARKNRSTETSSQDVRRLAFANDGVHAGLLYEYSEQLQRDSLRNKHTAGPSAPPSWSASASKLPTPTAVATSQRRRTAPQQKTPSLLYRPINLREECLSFFLRDLATDCVLADEIPCLPSHLRKALLQLAPKITQLDDISIEVLLLEGLEEAESPIGIPGPIEAEPSDASDWEAEASQGHDTPPEWFMQRLDLSHASVSARMLQRICTLQRVTPTGRRLPRLVRLRSLDLSHQSTIPLAPSLISILSSLTLTSLSLSGIHCSLFQPLEALASALPSLKSLDVSHNSWIEWDHLSHPDWATQWTELLAINVTECENLAPTPSFLDPEGKAGGPAVVIQALSLINARGRKRWLDVLA